jgi:flavin reductase (DIM6/NTAB) family NADH-FMN oxidoreductase RutF
MNLPSDMRTAPVDEATFREVLGHFPTGVVLVTGMGDDGEPIGMIVGSFTSVSIEPAIVGFLPTKTSSTWRKLRALSRYCVNVLGADQTEICSRFSSKNAVDKFDGVTWSPSPGGAPMIHGCIAYIDCTVRERVDAGDHEIVLADVTHLEAREPKMPLLFFQGGFGRFSTHSLVLGSAVDIIEAVTFAESARPAMEALAEELDAECSLLARAGDSDVVVAVAAGPSIDPAAMLGGRIPLMPPLGALVVAYGPEQGIDEWLGRRHRLDSVTDEEYRERLASARERGWIVDMLSQYGEREFYAAIQMFSEGSITPSQFRDLRNVVTEFSGDLATFTPHPDEHYDLAGIMTAVFSTSSASPLVMRVSQLPAQAGGAQVARWIDRVTEVGRLISDRTPERN